jgi:hypothetical protein
MLYRFHANVFARPDAAQPGVPVTLRDLELATVCTRFDAFLPLTFERACEALARLPRIDVEPDGFFVHSGELQDGRWQVDGHLYDFGERLHRVELHGECPAEAFDAILRCLGWPAVPLAFELVREGVALEEAAFRRWAQG